MRHQRLLREFQVGMAGKGVANHIPCLHFQGVVYNNFTSRARRESGKINPKPFPFRPKEKGQLWRQVFWFTIPLPPDGSAPGFVSLEHLADFVGSTCGLGTGNASALADLQMYVAGLQLARRGDPHAFYHTRSLFIQNPAATDPV